MSLESGLLAFNTVLINNLSRLERGVVIGVGESVVDRSPVGDPDNWKSESLKAWAASVGYVGGRFRANWQYGISTRPTGDLPDIDASGAVSLERIINGVSGISRVGNIHYITNNLPYAQALEDGWSDQAPPNYIVQDTVFKWQRIANEQALLINP